MLAFFIISKDLIVPVDCRFARTSMMILRASCCCFRVELVRSQCSNTSSRVIVGVML